MRYPENLKKGGTIGFVAPSFGCATLPYSALFEEALKRFENEGYRIHKGINCDKALGIGISNTPECCAREFEDEYTSAGNDVLISCGGGELMCGILDHIDWDKLIKAEPKWFMGYSDNTNLTYLLTTICDVASVYGPCASSFGQKPLHGSLKDAFGILTGETKASHSYDMWERDSIRTEDNPYTGYNLTETTRHRIYAGNSAGQQNFRTAEKCAGQQKPLESGKSSGHSVCVKMEGRFLGGCMDCLVGFLGTSFDKTAEFVDKYKEDGIIWFLESCDLNVMSMRRVMLQLDRAGWFKHTKGFIIGRPYMYGQDMMGLDQYEAVYRVIEKYNVPVIMDADIGHLPPSMPIISGGYGVVEATEEKMEIEWKKR